jgi:ribosomal protein L23
MIDLKLSTYYKAIKGSLVTEKTTILTEEKNTYTFEVDAKSNKKMIKNAIKEIFNVEVESVNTLIRRNKRKRMKGKMSKKNKPTCSINKKTSAKKVAYVTLKSGFEISLANNN